MRRVGLAGDGGEGELLLPVQGNGTVRGGVRRAGGLVREVMRRRLVRVVGGVLEWRRTDSARMGRLVRLRREGVVVRRGGGAVGRVGGGGGRSRVGEGVLVLLLVLLLLLLSARDLDRAGRQRYGKA